MPFAPESQTATQNFHNVRVPSQCSVKGTNITLFPPKRKFRKLEIFLIKGILFKISDSTYKLY